MSKTKISFIPAINKYLIKVQDAVETTPGGIHIPDSGRERPMEGVILAIGPSGKTKVLRDVGPIYFLSELVLFRRYSGEEVNIDGEEYLIVDEEDILGKRT